MAEFNANKRWNNSIVCPKCGATGEDVSGLKVQPSLLPAEGDRPERILAHCRMCNYDEEVLPLDASVAP